MFGQYFRVQIGPKPEHRQVLHLQIYMHKLFPLYIEMYLLKEKRSSFAYATWSPQLRLISSLKIGAGLRGRRWRTRRRSSSGRLGKRRQRYGPQRSPCRPQATHTLPLCTCSRRLHCICTCGNGHSNTVRIYCKYCRL